MASNTNKSILGTSRPTTAAAYGGGTAESTVGTTNLKTSVGGSPDNATSAVVSAVNTPNVTGGNPAVPGSPSSIITGRPAGVPPLGCREDSAGHVSLFIGDLSPEVNDATLRAAFAAFPSLSECRVMYDPNTGRSRGYGFASFGDADDAHRALSTLNGEWLGARPLRINWANQKTHSRSATHDNSALPLSYEQILASSPGHNTTVYVGNLHPITTQNDIVSLFQNISFVREVRLQAERGYGFAVLETHEAAASAIHQLGNGNAQLHGRILRVSWGKDRNEGIVSHTALAGLTGIPGVFGGMMYGLQQPLAYGAGFGLPTAGFSPQAAAAAAAAAAHGSHHAQHSAAALGGLFNPATPYAGVAAAGLAAHQQAQVQAAQAAHAAQLAAANAGSGSLGTLGFSPAGTTTAHHPLGAQHHLAAQFHGLGGGNAGGNGNLGGNGNGGNSVSNANNGGLPAVNTGGVYGAGAMSNGMTGLAL